MNTEKNHPIPKITRHNFQDWEVGDSKPYATLEEVEAAQSAAYSYAKTHAGFKVTRRKTGETYRMWRIA